MRLGADIFCLVINDNQASNIVDQAHEVERKRKLYLSLPRKTILVKEAAENRFRVL